ncbi:hypothetical protein K7X08_018532 [Anisodus acutangulus]|uniref:Phosphotransferase n=1 Tax=Anisodus acutangulus TaxID=402998 RepID=A0A9Q1LX52_9SOLA|nr:hypothetical protein K7X08_018532 [Anisodus acutangulus]
MDISSATWWSEMDIMNMNDFQYIDMTPFDELSFTNNPFTACTYDNIQASQSAGIFEEKPAFCSSTNTIYQNTSYSNSPSPPPSSSPSVISFSNTNSPSATITTAAQNYFRNLNTSVKTEVASGTTINLSSSNISLDSDYHNSQQLFQAMGFGADDNTQKKSYCRTPLQAQDHVLAERKRRERLTQYFITLSTLIPNLKKELFDCITVELGKFISMHSEGLQGGEKNLGFTVSPTIAEVAASRETAITWKGSVFGDAVDDTIGVLAGGRYYSKESVAAVTLGMGTNAAYIESANSVVKWPDQATKPEEIAINIQWGNFRSSHLPITEFDTSLDDESSYPGSQIFEKLISGTYLGETVRRVLLKMAQESALFGDTVPPKLAIPYLLR